jgi:PAS domain-containing protein
MSANEEGAEAATPNEESDEAATHLIKCGFETLQAIRVKVVEASPDAKIVVKKQRYIVDMNEEAEYLFGYARRSIGKEDRRPEPNGNQRTARLSHGEVFSFLAAA